MGSAGNQKGIRRLFALRGNFAGLGLLYAKSIKFAPPDVFERKTGEDRARHDTERKGVAAVVQQNNKELHTGMLKRLCQRGVAFALATAMMLSLLPVYSLADELLMPPTQVTDQNDFPKIEFQTNFVRTEYGTLTGLMELSIRVGPSGITTVDGKAVPVPVSFQSVAATLQFNNKLFKPISWRWAFNENGTAPKEDIPLSNKNYYDVKIAAKKDDSLPGTGAIAQCGILEKSAADTRTMSTNVANGDQVLLFFKAESYGAKIDLAEMTTLAVVRFYVAPELMEQISIQKVKGATEPDGSPKYQVLFDNDTANPVTTRDQLNSAISSTTGTTNLLAALGLPADFTAVDFADDGDIVKSKSPANMALDYETGANEYYFVPQYDGTANTKEQVTYTPKNTTTTYTLDAPKTLGSKVLAVDPAAADGAANKYSYLSNLIPGKNIAFTVVSQPSFADNGDGRENMATVLFYDWDDTLIGVLVVPRNDDARALVNEYVRNNMIHPDLRYSEGGEPDTSTDKNLVTSLSRGNSYRGKYPSTPMGENGKDTTMDGNRPATPEGNDKLVGNDYPLTNKLDYVFVKRPMEKDETAVDANNKPINTWKQLGDNTQAKWDTEYPYIHGWALIPDDDLTDIDYTHPENIWTTIGVGELSDYTGLSFGAYASPADIASGAVELISEAKDFSIADFDFSQKDHSLGKGSVYAVKALYEPGESLQTTAIQYRMISEPYYNKLNYGGSSAGGAYSVDITIERANSDAAGNICGVARIREPAVRQDTTADIRWENEYLNNANVEEEQGKGKATFTNVVVDNGEEIGIQLVLSARQNKVDYYLINKYGANFVGGGSRTPANSSILATAHVLDNYNYKTDTSDVSMDGVSATYYDAPYEDRDGSYGFVLYCTINNIAQKLTEDCNGTLDTLDFNNYISASNLNDINLRNHSGDKPSGTNIASFRRALRAAAAEAVRLHDTGDDRAWDAEHGYAQFTYHQLQLFVSEYLDPAVATPTLRTAAAADAIPIQWCHLHEDCAALASGKPRSWDELVATAQRTDLDQNGKIDAIRLLTLAELETMSHIRADAGGTAFPDNRAFAIAFIGAVEAGNTTWDTIQDYIIRGTADASYAQENYWWYDGSTRISFGSLSDTVAAVQDIITPVKAPGETTAVARNAKINQLKPVYDDDYASGAVTTAWNNATKNLSITVGTDQGQKFKTWKDFRDKFVTAVRGAENNNVKLEYKDDDDAATRAKKLRDYWDKLQYSILHDGTYVAYPDPTQQAEMDGYWWYDGAVKVNNLATLIRAAQDANSGKPASMNMFAYSALYDPNNKELHFARNFQGEKYTGDTDADTTNNAHLVFSEFKEDIMAYVQEDRTFLRNNAPDWNRVQYYLIHGALNNSAISDELPYYWWKEGKPAQPVDFTLGGSGNDDDPAARADALAVALLDAAFRATYNGNPVAWDNLTADVLKRGRLVAPTTGAVDGITGSEGAFPADFTMYGVAGPTLDNLKLTVVALMKSISGVNVPTFPTPKATWSELQYYLLTGNRQTDGWIQYYKNYWWKAKDSNGEPPAELFKKLTEKIAAVADAKAGGQDGVAEANILRGWLTAEISEKLEFTWDGGTLLTDGDLAGVPWEDLAYSNPFTITWAQVEWLFFGYMNEYGAWQWDDETTARNGLLGYGLSDEPQGWSVTARNRARTVMLQESPEPNYSNIISNLSKRIIELEKKIQDNPLMLEQYEEELYQLMEATQRLQAILEGKIDQMETVSPDESQEGVEGSEDVNSPAPEVSETPDPAESPEVTESPAPEESPAVSEPPETPEPPETSETPVPSESQPPEEELPQPTVPGSGEPEVTPTPELTPTPEPTGSETPDVGTDVLVGPQESESPKVTGTQETMPEVIDPPPEEIFEDDPPEEADVPADSQDTGETDVGTGVPAGPSGTETAVIETLPPLGIPRTVQNRSATMDYRKLTTKTVKTKILASAGGMRMKQLKWKRIFSPPGQPQTVLLLLRSKVEERRRIA